MGILISTTYNLGLYQEEGRTWPCYLSMKLYLNTERGSPVYTCSLDAQGGIRCHLTCCFITKVDVLPDHC